MSSRPSSHHHSVAFESSLVELRDSYLRYLRRQRRCRRDLGQLGHRLNKFIVWASQHRVYWIDDVDSVLLDDYRYYLNLPRRLTGFRNSLPLQTEHLDCLRDWLFWMHREEWTVRNLGYDVGEPLYRERYHKWCSAKKQKQSGS